MSLSSPARRVRRSIPLTAALLSMLVAGSLVPPVAGAAGPSLPLGDADLPEARTVQTLAPGVQLTTIVRGLQPGAAADIATTTRGPWRVSVLSIDPSRARGQLQATYGPNLSQVERTSVLVPAAGALVGVNASFFTYTKSAEAPGDPVGLGIYRGTVLSEPSAARTEVDFVVDSKSDKVTIGRLTWSGSLRNRRSDDTLRLDHLNHPPVVPKRCRTQADPTTCRDSGDVVHFQRQFGPTPKGRGVEVVLDKSGCVVRSARTRGAVLAAGQTSVQATGRETVALLRLTRSGCLSRKVTLYDEGGRKIKLHAGVSGVAGRYRLTKNGRVVAPAGKGSFFGRNPRTIAGTTSDGTIRLVTIDGRRTTSVGTTLAETAAVARALGLTNAVNLDGGGSTAMAVRGQLVNQVSGSVERAVGDALVYVD